MMDAPQDKNLNRCYCNTWCFYCNVPLSTCHHWCIGPKWRKNQCIKQKKKIAAFYENDYSPVHKQYTMLDVSLPLSPYTVESTTNLSEGKGHCVQLLLLCSGGSVWLGVLSRKMKRGWEKRTCGSISRAVWTIIISKAWNHVVMLCSHSVLSTRCDMQIVYTTFPRMVNNKTFIPFSVRHQWPGLKLLRLLQSENRLHTLRRQSTNFRAAELTCQSHNVVRL